MALAPKIGRDVFLAPGAVVCGNVSIADDCCVFFNTTIRADRTGISIGERTNIQDNCLLHSTPVYPIEIGREVSIGHGSIIHGCRIADRVLVGMGAIIMNDVEIGENCIIGAGALVPEGMVIPDNSVAVGVPARVIKQVSAAQVEANLHNAAHYVEHGKLHAEQMKNG